MKEPIKKLEEVNTLMKQTLADAVDKIAEKIKQIKALKEEVIYYKDGRDRFQEKFKLAEQQIKELKGAKKAAIDNMTENQGLLLKAKEQIKELKEFRDELPDFLRMKYDKMADGDGVFRDEIVPDMIDGVPTKNA